MKILLTGYKGLIGSNLKQSFSNEHSFHLIEKDFWNFVTWPERLDEMVSASDVVLHIGAIADTMLEDESELLKYNYTTSKHLFDACKKYRKKVVYASSAACIPRPANLYGWTKYAAECYLMELGMPAVALRYFNVYGNDESHKNNMASVAYQAYKAGKFKLFKETPTRDFVYIDDVVDATILAITSPSGIYEVGTGESRAFEVVLDLMKIPYTYREDVPPIGYQYYTKSNSIKWLPNWKPKYNLEEGIKKYKEYLNK